MYMKRKTSKHFVVICLFFVLLTGFFGILLQKYAPLLFHNTIYYCQELIKSINTSTFSQRSNSMVLVPVFFILALVGIRLSTTVVQLIIMARKLSRQKIRYHSAILNKLIQDNNLRDKVVIIKNSQHIALCYGLLRPKIYLSTGLLNAISSNELGVILKHEKHHLEHNDNLSILFAHIVQNTFPLVPLLSDLVNNFRIEQEIAADAYAAEGGKRQYVASVLKKLLKEPQPAFAYFPSFGAEDTIQARIESLFFKKQYSSHFSTKNTTLSFFSILILLGLVITPALAIELHENGQDAIMVCINNQQCVTQCKENIRYIQNMSPALNKSTPYSPASTL